MNKTKVYTLDERYVKVLKLPTLQLDCSNLRKKCFHGAHISDIIAAEDSFILLQKVPIQYNSYTIQYNSSPEGAHTIK